MSKKLHGSKLKTLVSFLGPHFLTHLLCEFLCVLKYAEVCKHAHSDIISIYSPGKSCQVCTEAAISAF